MKWVVLIFALFGLVPYLARECSRAAAWRKGTLIALAFSLFHPMHINLISDELYRGDSRGIEVTSVDLLALALFGGQQMHGDRRGTRHPFLFVRLLYLAAVLLSLNATPDLLRSSYSVWKLVRMLGVFSVMYVSFLELELASAALDGLALGVFWEGTQSLIQKYAYHMVRVCGTQSHPNSLAMIVNLVSPTAFALVLSRHGRPGIAIIVVFAAMCDVFSLSRGGMMMFVLATLMVLGLSMLRGVTTHKIKVVAVMVVGALAALAKSLETILKRFNEAPKESEIARKLFNMAAKQMAEEHTFGVGINMYSWVLDHGGYADRIGIEPGDRNGIAHHIYWLTAAETGYFGLACYLLLLATVLITALRLARRPGVDGEIGVGISAGLTVTYIQGTAEWIARQTTMAYCFWLFAAIVAARLHATQPKKA